MNEKHLFESIGTLDEKLLARSETMSAKTSEPSPVKTRQFPRILRTGLIAAALVCVSAATVFAVSNLISMNQGKIDMLDKAPSREQTADSDETLRGSYMQAAKDMEAFVAEVGQSVTDNGITVTLDQVSMDAASLDLFFTLSGKEAIQEAKAQLDEGEPSWAALQGGGGCSFLDSRVNGKEIVVADQGDSYLAEDGTIKVWEHYLLSEMPQGNVITLELLQSTGSMLERSGNWSFVLELDGASVRSGAKVAQPGVYKMKPLSLEDSGFPGEFLENDLHLEYLAFGPKGGVIHTQHELLKFERGDLKMEAATGLSPFMTYITDSTGRELHAFQNWNSPCGDTLDLTPADPEADSITLTPVQYRSKDGTPIMEDRTVTTEEMKAGVKLKTTPLGGFEIQNYTVQNGVIRYELVPFGWCGSIELIPYDDEVPMLNGRSGLCSVNTDPRTGVITVRTDYYAAQDSDLEKITQWHYIWTDAELDKEQAVTLPLAEVQ